MLALTLPLSPSRERVDRHRRSGGKTGDGYVPQCVRAAPSFRRGACHRDARSRDPLAATFSHRGEGIEQSAPLRHRCCARLTPTAASPRPCPWASARARPARYPCSRRAWLRTPIPARRACRADWCVVGGVDDGNRSTWMSSVSLTGNWSSIATLIGKSWPLRTLVLNERSSVFDVATRSPADPSLRLTTVRSTLTLSSAPKPSRTISSLEAAFICSRPTNAPSR